MDVAGKKQELFFSRESVESESVLILIIATILYSNHDTNKLSHRLTSYIHREIPFYLSRISPSTLLQPSKAANRLAASPTALGSSGCLSHGAFRLFGLA